MYETPDLYLLPVLIIIYILSTLTMSLVGCECVFDKVQPTHIPSTFVQYVNTDRLAVNKNRHKRDLISIYQPMRIHVEFHDLDSELTTSQQENLRNVVMDTIKHVTEIFKVVPVKERLVLGRSFREACKEKIISGINTGKCYKMKASYDGEYCLDWFKIPDNHLEGFYLYNTTRPDPVKEVYAPGAGLSDTDYILYVRALTSQTCIKQGLSTIAYAGYCQLDQTDRPIAGYVNFCPVFFRDHSYNRDKAKLTALHELFHALGFASDLFPKFKECQPTDAGISCTARHSPVREVFGVPRLVTPCAVNFTSEHFRCRSHPTENEFGPILQIENGKPGSHWDSAFMYGSLMTAKIGLPHLTILDPITLAVFEDSGWYKVNYDYAERFLWGKDGGCQFGLNEGCQEPDSLYYCLGSSQGCHFLHLDKAVCETDESLHGCRVYKSKPEDSCLQLINSTSASDINFTGEAYGLNSRCFVSNLTKSDHLLPAINVLPVGRCYETLCNDTGLYIQVHDGPYYFCPWGLTVQIPGYGGMVQCPDENIMCLDTKGSVMPEPEPTPEVTERHPVDRDTRGKVCIDIQYGKSTYGLVHLDSRLFQQCNLDVILKTTGVSRRRLEEYEVIEGYENRALFRFNLLPAVYSDQGPTSDNAITLLRRAINTGNFTFVIPPNGPKYTASSMMVMDLGPKEAKVHLPSFVIVSAILGAFGGLAIIILLIVFLQRRNAYRMSNSRELNMTTRHTNQPLSSTHNNTASQRSATRSHGIDSQSEYRNGLVPSHSRQNSYSSPFRCPPSAQNLPTMIDNSHDNTAYLETCIYNDRDHEHLDIDDSEGHINTGFQLTESPSRSPVHNNEPLNVTSIAIV